jgi:hypothetical protein
MFRYSMAKVGLALQDRDAAMYLMAISYAAWIILGILF